MRNKGALIAVQDPCQIAEAWQNANNKISEERKKYLFY